MNPFFYTSISASRIQIYAVRVILNGTTLVGDVEGRDGTFVDGTRGILYGSSLCHPFHFPVALKLLLSNQVYKKCTLLKGQILQEPLLCDF